MGVSMTKQVAVEVPEEYVNVTYCVVRTSGSIDRNHHCLRVTHNLQSQHYETNYTCMDIYPGSPYFWAGNHAVKYSNGWRVFLQADGPMGHVCGWRQLTSFWPLKLDGQPEKIDEWRRRFTYALDELNEERLHKAQKNESDD
jgi:hypothetical protein